MDADEDPVSITRAVVEEFIDGFNARDDQRHRDLMNFPSVILVGGQFKVWDRPEDYSFPWDRLVESEGWRQSTLDSVEVVQEGVDKVHLLAVRRRRREVLDATWALVITRVEGHWGVQCRSNFIP